MQDTENGVEKIRDTLKRLEALLVRFEIDTAAQLHVVGYRATIAELCNCFQQQMSELMREPAARARSVKSEKAHG